MNRLLPGVGWNWMYSIVNGIDRSSASVGFIHKESITIHGHTIVKFRGHLFAVCPYIILCFSLKGRFAIDRYFVVAFFRKCGKF